MSKKTYFDNLNEISKEELMKGLLGYGLFTEKLPPFLTSKEFYSFFISNLSNENKNDFKGYIKYESMRNINIPRILAIPNPVGYGHLCNILSKNWDLLLEHFKRNTTNESHKISRIHIRKIKGTQKIFETNYGEKVIQQENKRHLFEMNYKNLLEDDYPEPDLLIGKKYIVNADISNCFPSIYTHSISWALVGKATAKNNKQFSEWYNKIDKLTGNIKDGETHGILIGPHSSNLISEIILVAIDNKLSTKYKYIRNIDDYTCYVESHDKAEDFLLDLSIELKKYGLLLNNKKTEISKLPLASTEYWVRKMRGFIFPSRDQDKLKLNDVRVFLDISLELMDKNKENAAILNYAIKVLSNKEMQRNAKDYLIKTIHHLILLYPYLIPLLEEKVFDNFHIEKEDIKTISKSIFQMGKEKKLYQTMSFSLYFSIKYDFKLNDELFTIIEKSEDTTLMLLAYLHDKKFNNNLTFYNELAIKFKNNIDEYWLFVYEVLNEKDLPSYWKKMKLNKITFIKSDFI